MYRARNIQRYTDIYQIYLNSDTQHENYISLFYFRHIVAEAPGAVLHITVASTSADSYVKFIIILSSKVSF